MKKILILLFSLQLLSCASEGGDDWDEPLNYKLLSYLASEALDWTESFPAFKITQNLYGVGTYDLGVFLITSDQGHILINTGVEGSYHQIKENIESLGFKLDDVKILLTMQAHWDHVAEFARIKKLTSAEVWATEKDALLLEDGGLSDPHLGGEDGLLFRSVKVDKIIRHGDYITLGDIKLEVHEHPGHTIGSSSYSMVVNEQGRTFDVVIVNMGTINPGKALIKEPTYEGIDEDFSNTFEKQKNLKADIWVSAHAGFYGLHDKYKPGQTYSIETFYDPEGYQDAVKKYETKYKNQRRDELGL